MLVVTLIYPCLIVFLFCCHHFSGSMEPAFQRGDILFLTNQDDPIRVGEIVVFKIKDRDIPIVHRVMKVHEKTDGTVYITIALDSRFAPLNLHTLLHVPIGGSSHKGRQ